MTGQNYLLDNRSDLAPSRFENLEKLYDWNSSRLLARHAGEGDTVWMPGAGSGSLADYAATVVEGGEVHVTDMDTRHFITFEHPNVLAYTHDLLQDPYPACDVIHARLVLQHVPGWTDLLPKLRECLLPGGVLIVEELDPITPYRPDPVTEEDYLQNKVGDGFTKLLGLHGADYGSGRKLVGTLREAGFNPVEAEAYQATGMNGNAAVRLMQTNARQTADELIEHAGLTREEIDRYVEILDRPETWFHMPVMYSVVATRGTR